MKKQRNEIVVGTFVLIGSIVLSTMLFFVSSIYLFRTGMNINVLYDYVSILDKGAPIRMAGVRVGEVSQIGLYFDEKAKRNRVRVKLFIESSAEIRENYTFEIRGTHVLSEPHIEITPVEGDAAKVTEGAVLEGMKLEPLENLINRAQSIAENLDEMVAGLHDAFAGEENTKNLKDLVKNLSILSTSLQEAVDKGDLPKTMENIKVSSEAIRDILEKTQNGEGTVGGFLVKDEIYNDMRDLMSDVKKHPWKLLKKK